MRHSIAVLVACLVFGSACASVAGKGLAQSPEDAKKVAEQDAADDALQRKLESTVVDVEFNDDALEDAIKAIRDKAGVNLAVQWGAIEITGVKRDRAVTQQPGQHLLPPS